MTVSGVHHSCVIVSDMEQSLHFYRDTLGFKETINITYDADWRMMDLPGTEPKQHLVMLDAGNVNIELIQYLEPVGRPYDRRPCDTANMHICFQVDDIQRVYHEMSDKKLVSFHRDPAFIGDDGGALANHGYVYFRGPDNEILEFIQVPEKVE